MDQSALFSPLALGDMKLNHRAVLAPLTRSRSKGDHANDMNSLYYHQRATLGGLLISEGTWCSKTGRGYDHVPGILTADHAEAWKKVTSAVHSKGGYIFAQLWHVGRVSRVRHQPDGQLPVTASATPAIGATHDASRSLTIPEIEEIVEEFKTSAMNALNAGFDGIEIHSAHGYLLDEFLQTNTNQRTDKYGGSFENRTRFLHQVLDAVLTVWPSSKVALRLSPYCPMFGVSCDDTYEMFKYCFQSLNRFNLVYLSITEPVWGMMQEGPPHSESILNTLLPFVPPQTAVLLTGGYTASSASEAIDSKRASLIAFGRPFITNPDLVMKMRDSLPLTSYASSEGFYAGSDYLYTSYKTHYEAACDAFLIAQKLESCKI